VTPGYLCNKLLHNFQVRPHLGKRPHVLEVPGREALHLCTIVQALLTQFNGQGFFQANPLKRLPFRRPWKKQRGLTI